MSIGSWVFSFVLTASMLCYALSKCGILRRIAVVFLGVVMLWVFPGIVDIPYLETLGVTIPAMAGVVLLCVLRIEGAPLIDFVDSIKNGDAWRGQIMVCVSVMLGNVLMLPEAGIRELLSDVFATVMDKVPAFCMVIIMTAFIILMTNFMSDSVTITVVSAVMMPVVLSGAAGIIEAKIFTVLMGFTGSLAFATPAACANAVILSGSGWVRHSEQFKMGSLMAVTAILVVSIMTIPVIKALFV